MKFIQYRKNGALGLAVDSGEGYRGIEAGSPGYPGDLKELLGAGSVGLSGVAETLATGAPVDPEAVELLPPVPNPDKIICAGLNYYDHAEEAGFPPPEHLTFFSRYASSMIGHEAEIVKPAATSQFDYEGELAVVIGKGGRHIGEDDALEHVAGYSIFNDVSARDFQMRTPQWTMGKNFDATGPFGPCLVSADALPPGCAGLELTTRLNGEVVQQANIDSMIFPVARIVALCSEVMTLAPGDVIITGTPAGVAMGGKPPRWLRAGDVCEVEIDGIGVLRNRVRDEG